MSDWVAAVFGLAGAGVGAVAAIWGANRAAKVSANMLSLQLHAEDRRWQRDQRQTAYQAMLEADLRVTAAVGLAFEDRGEAGTPPADMTEAAFATRRQVYAAASLIEIAGPQRVAAAARELLDSGSALVALLPIRPGTPLRERTRALLRHEELRSAFRQAAREVLGYIDNPATSDPNRRSTVA
ncbi:hypothetical protein ACWD7F_36780 [Streptomyces sp. NPDC005122]